MSIFLRAANNGSGYNVALKLLHRDPIRRHGLFIGGLLMDAPAPCVAGRCDCCCRPIGSPLGGRGSGSHHHNPFGLWAQQDQNAADHQ